MKRFNYAKLSLIFVVGVVLFVSSPVSAQSIDGTSSFCAGQTSTYNFTPSNGWTSAGTMACVGCDQSSIQADGQSISLVWLPNQTNYYIVMPIKQHVFFFDIFNTIYFYPISTPDKPLLICSSENSTSYVASQRQVPLNDSGCSNPPSVFVSLADDPDAPNFPTKGYPFDTSQGDNNSGLHAELNADRYIEFTAYWKPGWQGTITITLQFDRRTKSSNPFSSCDSRRENIATFTWRRYTGSPGGSLSGGTDVATINSTVNFNYVPDPSYGGQVQGIKYFLNGTQISDQSTGCNLNLANTTLTSSGPQVFATQLLDRCGVWHDGPSKTVTVQASCAQDNPANVSSSISGDGITLIHVNDDPNAPIINGFYQVTEGNTYAIGVAGITDFATNYAINYGAGQADLTISGNTFSINKALGDYQIGFTKKPGSEGCPDIPALNIFLGGNDAVLDQNCPVVLPDDVAKFGFDNVSPSDPSWSYFAATVKSRSITIKPGITLAKGAELILIQDPPQIPEGEKDGNINFVQTTSYDEYNNVLSQGRNYFDNSGRHTQSQSKNLSSGVILANATIYDAYARGALSTLAAPVTSAKVSSDGCGNTSKGLINFKFSSNFIKAKDGSDYNASNFDIKNGVVVENDPSAVQDIIPGTLGWYYSTNNGDASPDQTLMNEPLVAATQFPYSRTLWYRDGTQDVKSGSKPGDAFRAGNNHLAVTKTEGVDAQDPYLAAYLNMREKELNLPKPPSTNGEFLKSTVTDENNRKSVSYFDKGGSTIISLYFGSSSTPITTSYQFYDLIGRTVATISPNGVANYDGTNYNDIDKTTNNYNSRGLLKSTTSTDGGTTEYIYRKDGNIRFSQNAEQRKTGRFSYTHYDRSGRLIESGEHQPGNIAFNSSEMTAILENVSPGGGLSDNDGSFNNRDFIYYDLPDDYLQVNLLLPRKQRFVNGAISHTKNENNATWFSYDEQGRIEWLVQNITGLGVKTIDYRYGSTGALREVAYQAGAADQFTHYYEYDNDGRLFKAYTTRQPLQYDVFGKLANADALTLQATYFYYVHGPLKRVEYANKLQGIDYTYTADGSLKGINHFDPTRDPGHDAPGNNGFRPDVFGITLDYFDSDFSSSALNTGLTVSGIPNQYAGHIKTARWHGPVQPDQQWGYAYTYDDRYQFAKATWGQAVGDQLILDPTSAYQEKISGYDANGNIDKLLRKGNLGNNIADFQYNYTQNTNQLSSVNQGTNTFRSYSYNGIGQMTKQEDASGKQMNVAYDVTGKVTSVVDESNKLIAGNAYSDNGFRLSKTAYDNDGNPIKTWYVHDANGNVIATYQNNTIQDFPVYAAGKIGVFKPQFNMTFYEVTDHLGTVRAVIGDKFTHDYLATMEDDWINQGFEKEFVGIKPIPTADYINKTPDQVTLNGITTDITSPSKVIRINNGQDNPKNPVGGGIMLWVHPGDVINTEVYAKYANFDGNNHSAVGGAAGYLYNLFIGAQTGVDLTTVFNGVDGAPTGVYGALGKIDDNLPKAFLTYLLFDKDMVPLRFDLDQVTEAAEIPTTFPETQSHERLHLDNIKIEKEGFIFIYVSNLSDQNMDVYFDDLKVSHQYSDIVAGGDYYPFGLEISDRQITREEYRFKYQGQYSEKDDETKWNHFELREYDPVIGRWLSPDPKGQFFSTYVAMGNDPVDGTDPDGGFCCDGIAEEFAELREMGLRDTYRLNEKILQETDLMGGVRVSKQVALTREYPQFSGVGRPNLPLPDAPRSLPTSEVSPMIFAPVQPTSFLSAKEPGFFGTWSASTNILLSATYEIADAVYVTSFFFTPWRQAMHLDRRSLDRDDKVKAFATTVMTLAPVPKANVTANRIAGNAFRDELGAALEAAGRTVKYEVPKKTPFGMRYIDIEVWLNGQRLGGIETKVGSSRYHLWQRLKDWYLRVHEGYVVNVARKPK